MGVLGAVGPLVWTKGRRPPAGGHWTWQDAAKKKAQQHCARLAIGTAHCACVRIGCPPGGACSVMQFGQTLENEPRVRCSTGRGAPQHLLWETGRPGAEVEPLRGRGVSPASPSGLEPGQVEAPAFPRSVDEHELRVQQPGPPDSKPLVQDGCAHGTQWQQPAQCGRATPTILRQHSLRTGALRAGDPGKEEATAGHHSSVDSV